MLVLDEPTNDLDIETLDLLEELLAGYDGTLFLVSHDRAFLDNVVTQVIAAEGDGRWGEYAGGYGDWQRVQAKRAAEAAQSAQAAARDNAKRSASPADKARAADSKVAESRPANRPPKLSFNDKRELEALPERIAALEDEQTALHARMADPALYQSAPQDVAQIKARLEALDGEIEPDEGTVRRGTRQTVAYFDQLREQLDPELPLTEVISPGSDYVEIGGEKKHVIGYLGDFLFAPQRARSPVK